MSADNTDPTGRVDAMEGTDRSETDDPTGTTDDPTGTTDDPTGTTDDPTGTADDPTGTTESSADQDDTTTTGTEAATRRRPGWPTVGAAAAAIAVTVAGVLGYLKYRDTAGELARLRQAETDRAAVAAIAKDYAERSLNYSYDDPEAFFRAVEDGVSPVLQQKFVDATDFLSSVMRQAQVTSTGEVVATDATEQPGDLYQVVVSAYQTTRNLQHPEPRVSVMLLQITVNRVGDSWQVSDIGPMTGSRPETKGQSPVLDLDTGPRSKPRPTPPGR